LRAVVAGGAGFLGSHLCERLIADGYDVVCVDNLSTGVLDNVRHLLAWDSFTFHRADVVRPFDLVGDVDLVVHLASPASPADYLRMPIETLRAGSEGTRTLLELARHKNARFMLASTSEIYGDPMVHPQPESYWGNVNPVGSRAVYDEAKRYGEAFVAAYRRCLRVDGAIVRIFNTFGPRMRADDGRVIPTFVGQALRARPITVNGDGLQTRSLCYVSDLVDGIVLMANSTHAGPINMGNPREMTIAELARMVRDHCLSDSEIVFRPEVVEDPRRRRPDISLASSVLGWEPRTSLEDGLDRTIEWFSERACEPSARADAGSCGVRR
jgi:dTDP-glucose 4,6-dehydratase